MITAKNYAAQAVRDMSLAAINVAKLGCFEDSIKILALNNQITKSIKFAMPDYGKVFDNNHKGLIGNAIRLPFSNISIEYYVPVNTYVYGGEIEVKRRLICATEVSRKELVLHDSVLPLFGDIFIVVTSVLYSEKSKTWSPDLLGIILPTNWDYTSGLQRIGELPKDPTNPGFACTPFIPFPGVFNRVLSMEGISHDDLLNSSIRDISSEVTVLLEFLEALSCSNIEQSIHQPASPKNAQRIKSHKLPIYETRFLTIKSTAKEATSIGIIGSHQSPRQHLRRGHIRRLESGNIWVNSCVVGDSSKGVINKQYRMAGL